MNEGRIVFAQLLNCLPKYEFDKCVARYHGNRRVRKPARFTSWIAATSTRPLASHPPMRRSCYTRQTKLPLRPPLLPPVDKTTGLRFDQTVTLTGLDANTIIQSRCAASAIVIQKPARRWSS